MLINNFMNEYINKINNLSNYTNLEKHDFSNKRIIIQ